MGTVIGSDIEIEVGKNYKGKINEIFGNTSQDGEPTPANPVDVVSIGSNINLFDKDSINWVRNNDGDYHSTTNNNTTRIRTQNLLQLKADKTYTLSGIPSGITINAIKFYSNESSTQASSYVTTETFTVPTNATYIIFQFSGENFTDATNTLMKNSNIKVEEGSIATGYTLYNRGGIDVKVENKNLFDVNNANVLTAFIYNHTILASPNDKCIWIKIKPNTTYTISKGLNATTSDNRFNVGTCINKPEINVTLTNEIRNGDGTTKTSQTITSGENDNYLVVMVAKNSTTYQEIINTVQIEVGETATTYLAHAEQNITIPLPEGMELCKIGEYSDKIFHNIPSNPMYNASLVKGGWYKKSEIGKIVLDGTQNLSLDFYHYRCYMSYQDYGIGTILSSSPGYCNQLLVNNTETSIGYNFGGTQFFIRIDNSTTTITAFNNHFATNNLILYGILKTSEYIQITDTETINALDKIQNIILYEGYNNISSINNIETIFQLEYDKIVEYYNAYISEDGYFNIPSQNVRYLISFSESNIPIMPEAIENTVKIAGRDGDIPLSTNYEPMSFNIVCYTEDNLTPEEKKAEKNKISNFLNSIKKETTELAFETEEKFYDVKYNGNLVTEAYPKHIKFNIPLKASNPYGKNIIKTVIEGSNSPQIVNSNTIEDVGVKITILGPATLPELAINNYEMIYNYNILEGAKVIIDTGNSTITNINASNVKTNVMPYYNHQFPKIHSGENELKVQSGIERPETQVTFEWYDLTL